MKGGRWAAEQVAHRRGKVTVRLSQATLFLSIGTTQRGTKKTVHYSHKLKGCRAQDSTKGSFFSSPLLRNSQVDGCAELHNTWFYQN